MVRLDEEWKKHKEGKEETNEETPTVKVGKQKPIKEVFTDNEQLTKLCEDYPAAAIALRKWVAQKLEYFNENPFKVRTKAIFNEVIKENVIFINPNIKEVKQSKVQKQNENILNDFKKNITSFFDIKHLAEQFCDIQPVYYDNGKNWWIWSYAERRWTRVDETDILNAVDNQARVSTIQSKVKNEILEALKQVSRKRKPKEIKPTWVQFRDKIIDIMTGEIYEATYEYFVTNPLPHAFPDDNFELTPNMDRIFAEWVGEDYVKTLYEILAYSMLPDYPINRIFCFIGAGMNGKSKFLELLRRFIGGDNCCSTELDTLIQSRFEVTRLHKKLICMMGETNFGEMSKTSLLKKLSGGDLIGFEYKNKDPLEDKNYAKIIIATNNLPATTDKTVGFYRRWMIIDFPNQFSEKKDILAEIPDEEYNALGLKCCNILKELLEKREFHKEGTIEERVKKYEDKSNFLDKFIKEYTVEDSNGFITSADFYKKFSAWCKENRHREMSETSVGMNMKRIGIEQQRKHFDWLFDGKGGQLRCWVGLKWLN